LLYDAQASIGPDTHLMQEPEQLGIAFVQAHDGIVFAFGGLGEGQFAPLFPRGGLLGEHGIAVGAGATFAQLFAQLGFKCGRHGVLEALGLFVDLVPFHAEDFAEHAFDQVVAERGPVGCFAARGGEADDAVLANLDEAIAFEPFHGHGDGRRGDLEPVREGCGYDRVALGLGLKNGLQVVLFRYVESVFHGICLHGNWGSGRSTPLLRVVSFQVVLISGMESNRMHAVRQGTWKRILLFVLSLAGVGAVCAPAQQRVDAPRSDGHTTPLLIYTAEGAGTRCAPLAIVSHGAGGSENGYRYLAEAMREDGFTTIVMGHRESGFPALRADMMSDGIRAGIEALVADRNAEEARLLDVGAALRWADQRCHAPFRVLLGHSMGAETVMLEAGAKNMIGVSRPPAGRDRFDAYVALSPEGPGVVFPEDAWEGIHKPVLILTGTRDQSLKGGPQARLVPWSDLPGAPGHCQWEGVLDGATHMNFAGTGLGHEGAGPLITGTIRSFLAGARAHACALPAPITGSTLKSK
jgi:dienelactone hydrolase